jgi:Ferritin-like
MLKLRAEILQNIRSATTAVDLHQYLQSAIRLEHATIPPYLTALYSIKSGRNQEAVRIILSIVRQEMLHMTIAANILNAIAGHPEINHPKFIPSYPGKLPMNIGDDLIVGLQPLSKQVLKNTFMQIEEPEDPINFPVKPELMLRKTPEYATIGQFYQAIIDKLVQFGSGCIKGDPSRQVVNEQWFPQDELFAITNLEQAVKSLTIIVQQGEGTHNSPLDPEGAYAHYYRFAEIYHGRRLRTDPTVPEGYSYSGELIPLDEDGIWNLVENSKVEKYQPGSKAHRLVNQFNYSYTNLLNGLHKTFNGEPQYLNTVMGLMYELKLQAQEMVEITDPSLNKQVAPAFQYAAINI